MESPENHHQRSVPLNNGADSLPLKDVVICCTSVPDEKRTELAGYAKQMGAVHRYDLTFDVTHLIVGAYDTPKYRYVAQQRPDVRPMTIGWIEAMRELWMNDQEIDLEALEKEHTLPTLHSLKFSMTGCDDPTERLAIAEKVKANGAVYEGDLTKQITHLISFRTEGAKYKAAKSWGLRIVSIEWLWDSLERGMILDEKVYDPSLPVEERGIGAWDQTKPRRTSLGKRSRDESNASLEGGKRKLRRTASTKLSSGNDKLWGDIVGGGTVTQVQRSGVWESTDDQTLRSDSETKKEPTQSSKTETTDLAADPTPKIQGIFSGCRFYLDGFEEKRAQILCNHIIPHGADISTTIEGLLVSGENDQPTRRFRVIPSSALEEKCSTLPESESQIETITEWWVERCLHHKSFQEPSEHVIGRPFPKFPIEEFRETTISSAAFAGIDLLHVKKAVELIGAKYSEDMTPQSSVLVTKSAVGLRKDKADHAQEWEIPIVNATWLWDSITAGDKLPIQKYRFRPQRRTGSVPAENTSRHKQQVGRSKSEILKPVQRANSHSSSPKLNNSRQARWDAEAAFVPDEPAAKEETDSHALQPAANASDSSDLTTKTEPLSEISHNSPSRTVSTAPAPSDHPGPRTHGEDISSAVSSLLARTKTAAKIPEQAEEGRKRGGNRILGRVTSNLSTASTPFSRASSVDSTATHGNPVEYPTQSNPGKLGSGQAGAERKSIEPFMNAENDRTIDNNVDSQPPATQLQYDDPESKEYKERVMARMLGEKVDTKRAGLTKEKTLTLGDIQNTMAKSRTRRGTVRGQPGFR